VIPDSPSAKEVSELWVYIQDRLARLVKDPSLAPENRPEHFSISSLSGGSEDADALDPAAQLENMPALNAKLRDAYTPPVPELAPVDQFAYPEQTASAAVTPPAPPAPPVQEVARPEFNGRKTADVARRPTLFGGAGRQPNTFGRRNWD
jgi:hypothetical protein